MADRKTALINLVVLLAVGLSLFGVITALISTYTGVDATTGAPTAEGMTNSTIALLNIVPLLVIVGFVIAAVYMAVGKMGDD